MNGDSGAQIGVDVGSSLTKLAVQPGSGPVRYHLFRPGSLTDVVGTVLKARPVSVGLTGGGAARLAAELGHPSVAVNEFTAWGTGANRLLPATQTEPYLLVSLGTGTSVMLVEDQEVRRLGGTALGGGTILGLGAALLGAQDFHETCSLAASGNRDSVDLLVKDIYPEPDSPLNGNLTAASFGRVARQESAPPKADVAAAIMRLVGENVALIAGGHAQRLGLKNLVFGGSTLRENPALAEVLREVSALLGLRGFILENGEFAGALGAMQWAPQSPGENAGPNLQEESHGSAG